MDNTFNVKDYFTYNFGLGDRPESAHMNVKLIVIGAILAVLGIIAAVAVHIAGLVLVVPGALLIVIAIIKFSKAKKVENEWQNAYNTRYDTWDAELEKFYEKTLEELNLKKQGMNRIGIDEENLEEAGVKPFSIHGQLYDGWYRYGKDGQIRTDGRQVTWLFFSKDQIYVYDTKFTLTGEKKKVDNTQEFFYSDIVSVSTGSVSKELPGGDHAGETIEAEEFRLVVPGDKLSFAFTSNEEISRSVQAMKTKIRERKTA